MAGFRRDPGTEEVEWGGRRYRRKPGSPLRHRRVYFMATTPPKSYLHRDIYVAHHGPIPAGLHVHHRDHNPLNNDPANLVAIDPSTHAAEHYATRTPRDHTCDECGKTFGSTKWTENVRWCSPACKERWRRREGLAYVKPLLGPYREDRICEECGAPYMAKRPWARFCASPCKQRAGRRNRGETQ